MALLIATADGVYRGTAGGVERVLDCGRAMQLARRDGAVYAATLTGVFRSTDAGTSWTDLGLPAGEAWSVHAPDGGPLYVGGYPARLFATPDDGARWSEVEALQTVPGRDGWYCPNDDDEGRIRDVATVPGQPDRLLVAAEVGGLYRSDDGGATWAGPEPAVEPDVHHLHVVGFEDYLASCGRLDRDREYGPAGLFRTRDDGETWTRLDTGTPAYVRESIVHDDVVYTCVSPTNPGRWREDGGAGARLLESTDGGRTFEAVAYPGGPREIVTAWAVHDGRVVGGTGPRYFDHGRVIRRAADGWSTAYELPAAVHALASA